MQAPTTQPLPAGGGWVLGGRYRVQGPLGAGGMAEVFRAHDELLDRDVAVKVFRSLPDIGGDPNWDERRELELQSLAQLSHPHLITLFDGSVAGDGPAYLVLELVHGPDLATRLRDGPLPEPEVRAIGAQLADALGYVHAHGMVHRDVKPANILLGLDDGLAGAVRARLSDFGIVRMIDSARLTVADCTLGTASYIAPEQARGADVGAPADVYSLGLVLLEALTGRRCFDGSVPEALAARLTTAPHIPAELPEPWPALLAAMTEADPGWRPTAVEVAASLRSGAPAEFGALPVAAAVLPPPIAAPVAEPEPTEPRAAARRGPSLATAVVLAVLAAAAIFAGTGYFLLGGSAHPPGMTPTAPVQPGSTAQHSQRTGITQAAQIDRDANPVQPGARHRRSGTPGRTAPSTHAVAPPRTPAGSNAPTSAPLSSSSAAPSSTPPPSSSPSSSPSPTGPPTP